MADNSLINDIVSQLEYFDVERYLEDRHIEYWTEGKNVKQGWVNIQCPWCADKSNHLGIDLNTKGINCWACPVKGTIIRLILKIDKCRLKHVLSIVQEYRDIKTTTDYRQHAERKTDIKFPLLSKSILYTLHRKFLEGRGYDADHIFKKYNLRCVGPIGKLKNRLIIPFYYKKRLITYSARDVTGRAKIIYHNLKAEKSILSTKETLYNIDSCHDTAIVVEGPTDTWKIGNGCCATMGIKWTAEQMELLTKIKRVFILFDSEDEAQESANKLCSHLAVHTNVEQLELDYGDPGDMSNEEVKYLRKEVFGRIY